MNSLLAPGHPDPAPAARSPRPRVIGMLGGMSWESTAEYYRLANELVRERLGGLHSARCVLHSVDFAEIEAMQVEGRWDEAGELLAAEAARAGGRRRGAAAAVHEHHAQGRRPVQAAVAIPLLHLGDATAAAVRGAGLTTRRAARHGVHHGAGLLPRPAGRRTA